RGPRLRFGWQRDRDTGTQGRFQGMVNVGRTKSSDFLTFQRDFYTFLFRNVARRFCARCTERDTSPLYLRAAYSMLLLGRMKTLPKKLLPLIIFAIAVTSLFPVQPAQAYTVTVEQVGSDVVATGSGAFDLTGLNFFQSTPAVGGGVVYASLGIISMGPST